MIRFFLLILCAVGVLSSGCDGPQHNAQFGTRSQSDMLVYVDHIVEEYKFLRVIEKVVTYPPANTDTSDLKINYIELIDQFTNGNGGCPKLLSGGPGFSNATIQITSLRNHGLDFIIRIFATKYF